MLNLDLLQVGATNEAQSMLAEADALLANLSKKPKLSQAAIDAGPDATRSADSASPANLTLRCDVSGCAIVPVTRSSGVSSQSEQSGMVPIVPGVRECTLIRTTASRGVSSTIPELQFRLPNAQHFVSSNQLNLSAGDLARRSPISRQQSRAPRDFQVSLSYRFAGSMAEARGGSMGFASCPPGEEPAGNGELASLQLCGT